MSHESTEMELRVAWAIASIEPVWSNIENGGLDIKIDYRAQARAAIRAMRKPTKEMWEAAVGECAYVSTEAWQAMIDAASPPYAD